MLLHFPHLHPECVPGGPLPGVLFLDPGLETDPERDVAAGRFLPAGLPLAPAEARRLLEDCIRFGEQFANPKEMAFFGVQDAGSGRKESVSVLESELRRRLGGGSAEASVPDGAPAARAQFLLLLAWSLEERLLELRHLSLGVEQAWDRFGASLGVEEDDGPDAAELRLDSLIAHTRAPESAGASLPWPLLLEAVCAFLPEDAVLVVRDAEISTALAENGLAFVPADEALGLPPGATLAEAEAWRAAGLRRASEKRPLLGRVVRFAVASVTNEPQD